MVDVTAAATIRAPLSPELSPTLKKTELKALAAEENVELPEHVTKADIIKAIQEARDGLRNSE